MGGRGTAVVRRQGRRESARLRPLGPGGRGLRARRGRRESRLGGAAVARWVASKQLTSLALEIIGKGLGGHKPLVANGPGDKMLVDK